jgi:ATP-dependent Clp endopeptidase proteolytic subunit ClpP
MSDEEENIKEPLQINIMDAASLTPPSRTINMFGDLDEEKVENICSGLLYLKDTCCDEVLADPDDPEAGTEIIKNPIDFVISTWGGDALGMFAIYDLMRMIREECDINTFAVGKVMSAGVLLLAAGTKGNRRVGKYTRIMMHGLRGGHYGALHSLENEMKETKWLQEQHIKALVAETSMTKRQINTMLNRRVDVYLSAEEAVEMGIADIIV